MPGSCSNGFKSRPSNGAGKMRSNGLDVNKINIKKPTVTKPITANKLLLKRNGSSLAKKVTANVQTAKIVTQNSIEPSCPPHTAAKRKIRGKCELEVTAT